MSNRKSESRILYFIVFILIGILFILISVMRISMENFSRFMEILKDYGFVLSVLMGGAGYIIKRLWDNKDESKKQKIVFVSNLKRLIFLYNQALSVEAGSDKELNESMGARNLRTIINKKGSYQQMLTVLSEFEGTYLSDENLEVVTEVNKLIWQIDIIVEQITVDQNELDDAYKHNSRVHQQISRWVLELEKLQANFK